MSSHYLHTEEIHNLNAPREVLPILMNFVNPKSVLDVGCGTGTWLKAFAEKGIWDITGVDSEHIHASLLKIPKEKFRAQDLRLSWSLERKFDLVISLEVAEHLPDYCSDLFVETLVRHGDFILFSAAVPGQGGQNHLNEQWPAYWQNKFLKHGFYFHDVIRPQIWSNDKIEWWYRQNIFLITKEKNTAPDPLLSMVHPDLYMLRINNENSYLNSLKEGKQGLVISSKMFFNALIFKIKHLIG